MPKLDRPSSAGDSGGDKPPVPKSLAGELREPDNPPQARNPSHFEHSAAEQNNRNAAEGTGQNGAIRPKDKLPEERGTHGREGTAGAGHGSDHPSRPGDTSREGDSHTDEVRQHQALFDRQGQIIDTQKERLDTLKSDVSVLEKRNEKLEYRNDKLQDRVESLETRLEHKDQAMQQKDQTIDRLKARVAELERGGKSIGEQSAVKNSARTEQDREAQLDKGDRPRYMKIPSKQVTEIITKTGTALATIAVATGAVNGTAEKVAGGVAAIGLAYMEYRRQTNKKEKGEDDG